MFTITQYLLDGPLVYGIISDAIFFGSLYLGRRGVRR